MFFTWVERCTGKIIGGGGNRDTRGAQTQCKVYKNREKLDGKRMRVPRVTGDTIYSRATLYVIRQGGNVSGICLGKLRSVRIKILQRESLEKILLPSHPFETFSILSSRDRYLFRHVLVLHHRRFILVPTQEFPV